MVVVVNVCSVDATVEPAPVVPVSVSVVYMDHPAALAAVVLASTVPSPELRVCVLPLGCAAPGLVAPAAERATCGLELEAPVAVSGGLAGVAVEVACAEEEGEVEAHTSACVSSTDARSRTSLRGRGAINEAFRKHK